MRPSTIAWTAALALGAGASLLVAQGATPSLLPPGEPGTPLHVDGRIVGPGGPVANAALYVYQTDATGIYSNAERDDNTQAAAEGALRDRRAGPLRVRDDHARPVPALRPAGAHPPRGDAAGQGCRAVRGGLRGRFAADRLSPCRREGRQVLRAVHAGCRGAGGAKRCTDVTFRVP